MASLMSAATLPVALFLKARSVARLLRSADHKRRPDHCRRLARDQLSALRFKRGLVLARFVYLLSVRVRRVSEGR